MFAGHGTTECKGGLDLYLEAAQEDSVVSRSGNYIPDDRL